MKTKEQISFNMSRIHSSDTKIEIILGKALWKAGFRYRKQCNIFGKPDFVLKKEKIAIFCDSSFWHGYMNMKTKRHNFKSNKAFWINKIKNNIERDKKVNHQLKNEGWIVIRFWDFQIINSSKKCILKIKQKLIKK